MRMMDTSLGQVTHLVAQVEASQEERTTQFTVDIEKSIDELRTKADELRSESEDKARARSTRPSPHPRPTLTTPAQQ